ncbi:MAG: methionine adenosyltransferase regulatory beta subunit-related [Monoraphidium minutum]|nr:MAG: methionine adenosyltransferase regulatory beta subunit-related [Monoraphidium minutum]
MAQEGSRTIFITGGSGYLGSHLIAFLQREGGWRIGYTFLSNDVPAGTFGGACGFRVDLATGEGLDEALEALGPVDVVVNTAAISQPALCERDYARALAANAPAKLLDALERRRAAGGGEPLLIHLSTDQVYDGSRAMWTEADATEPVNAYGRSKLEAEQLIAARWPPGRAAALRASLIYGPEPPFPVGRPLFVQFVESALREGRPTKFFEDEFRCPVYVFDICRVISHLGRQLPAGPAHAVYNLGGPQRLSRVDMAVAVAAHFGYDRGCIQATPSAEAGDRGYSSPPDISMDMARLRADMPAVALTPFAEGLAEIFPAASSRAAS